MEEYIFVKSTNKGYVNEVYKILFRCGIHMLKQGLFHWIKPYSKNAIKHDCDTKQVILVKDNNTDMYTSTFQMYVNKENNLYVWKIATNPKVEGKGIGRKNMLYMEAYAKEHGCCKICLDVYKNSIRAVNFYQKLGFKIMGEKKSRFFSEFIMEKNII